VIIDLNETTVSKVAKKLVSLREEGGAVALGRVLTLIIKADDRPVEEAIEAANDASREHPMRVIAVVTHAADEARLDAQIRVGGDAGASEVVILHAYGEAANNSESLVTGLLLPRPASFRAGHGRRGARCGGLAVDGAPRCVARHGSQGARHVAQRGP
jgi:hypothetical protein